MDYHIWNYMEQSMDCLHCGSRYDMNNMLGKDVGLVSKIMKHYRSRHRHCRKQNKKGRALETYNRWYFQESQVVFDADLNQLYNLVKLRFLRFGDTGYDKFLELYNRSEYTVDFNFRSSSHDRMEVHKLFPKWRYFIHRQMWRPETREALIQALKFVGAKIVSKEDVGPRPVSEWNFHSPRLEHREPVRVWN